MKKELPKKKYQKPRIEVVPVKMRGSVLLQDSYDVIIVQ